MERPKGERRHGYASTDHGQTHQRWHNDRRTIPTRAADLGTWVQRNPPVPEGTWDWTTTTYDQFDQLLQQSVEMFGALMGTDNPDLRGFKRAGGKLVMWHCLADQLIYPRGTINYYNRVQRLMGGTDDTTDFARLFLAPGVTHCGLFAPGPFQRIRSSSDN